LNIRRLDYEYKCTSIVSSNRNNRSVSVAATTTPALAQNMTGGENMTAMGGNMSQPLEDESVTAGG
jgi:hypothetical protein